MPRVKGLVLVAAVSLAVVGCAPMFEFNLFAGIDNPPTPSAADYAGDAGLDALADDLTSPAVVDALTADPALVQEILDNLMADYLADGVSGDTDGQAAILYADLALKTTEGEELVNNVVDALLGGTLGASSNIGVLIRSIVPAEALATEAAFTAMVEALLAANDAYEQLGIYVDGDLPLGDGYWDNPLPPGSLPGDVAQKTIVAYTMAAVVDAVMTDLGMIPITEAEVITQLYLVATEQAHDPDMDDINVDAFASPDNWLLAILDVAGMRDMFAP